jgi:hypothetical protein
MIEGTCHCGAVRVEIPSAPTTLTSCNCSICRRLGSLWAYYPASQCRVTGETATYECNDRVLWMHRCARCGCTTHWTFQDPSREDRMGVNIRMMDPAVVGAARIRKLDGADTWKYDDEA